jgi:hypothetical protein
LAAKVPPMHGVQLEAPASSRTISCMPNGDFASCAIGRAATKRRACWYQARYKPERKVSNGTQSPAPETDPAVQLMHDASPEMFRDCHFLQIRSLSALPPYTPMVQSWYGPAKLGSAMRKNFASNEVPHNQRHAISYGELLFERTIG